MAGEVSTADIERARAAVRAFLAGKTKDEVLDAALERRLLCMAIFDMADMLRPAPHLAERGFWATVDIAGKPVRIPGRFAHVTGGRAAACVAGRRALGEHRDEILARRGSRRLGQSALMREVRA